MNYETILYEKEDGIAILTFNRPQVRNAENYQMSQEMRAAVEDARDDDEVKVLIVTGAGSAFHAGLDINVDLPPGTADAPLTVMQTLPVSGVIIVFTPHIPFKSFELVASHSLWY